MSEEGRPLVLFDDTCGLCNFIVRVLLRIDREAVLRFATLQGPIGQKLVGGEVSSIVYVERFELGEERRPPTFFKTDAVLAILTHLPAPWCWLSVLRVVPKPLRDFAYVCVARTRYALFGEYRPRPLAKKEWRDRFIDGSRQ